MQIGNSIGVPFPTTSPDSTEVDRALAQAQIEALNEGSPQDLARVGELARRANEALSNGNAASARQYAEEARREAQGTFEAPPPQPIHLRNPIPLFPNRDCLEVHYQDASSDAAVSYQTPSSIRAP